MIVDSSDKAGGLASTDVTPEGFVSSHSTTIACKIVPNTYSNPALRRRWPRYLLPLQVLR